MFNGQLLGKYDIQCEMPDEFLKLDTNLTTSRGKLWFVAVSLKLKTCAGFTIGQVEPQPEIHGGPKS